jgi:hypothetical protein
MAKSSRQKSKLAEAADKVLRQRHWIAEHGGDLAGYIAAYGDEKASPHLRVIQGGRYGLGGQAIYAADCEVLARAEADLERLTRLHISFLSRPAR